MTTKKTTKTKVDWDKVESVKPDTVKPAVTDSPETGVPFGSYSNIQQIIREYRKLFRTSPPEKNGVATSPTGNQYNYYMSGDVFEHADAFCESKGAMLEMTERVENGVNIISLTLEHIVSGEVRTVSANLGTPASISDFGARITYAPKYLIAVMFGVSVQTDTDAFNNGVKKSFEVKTNNTSQPIVNNTVTEAVNYNKNYPTSVTTQQPVQTPARSKSYELAKSFIEKSTVPAMLDEAVVKINNSKHISDTEKAELLALIATRRAEMVK